ncbi:MAG: GxxExxY protein [Blastocatellia bacterium]
MLKSAQVNKMEEESRQIKEVSEKVNLLSNAVIGCAIEVHRHLGPGFTENIYEEALCEELCRAQIPFKRQHPVKVFYKGRLAGEFRLDLLVGDLLIVELKAVSEIAEIHAAQARSYLKATSLQLALLINFNVRLLREKGIRRVVLT